ncbi:GNAT family N-acetyltransferase [Fumia xinanensis]|uniref:Uncharacterized protein n=1 Tax=Fumia xinanensis TaxID=2763659 RepID=A0A926I7P7_9FIRM|nr:hypothetical protein [Fumia xinanensis]MBC8560159.1 hypothetical protein [Fumia xinanensis]
MMKGICRAAGGLGLCPFSDPAADFAPSKPARLPVKGGEENAGDKGTRELRTGRLTLRRFVLPDADVMFQNYAADGRVTRFLSWEPYQSAEEVRRFVASGDRRVWPGGFLPLGHQV